MPVEVAYPDSSMETDDYNSVGTPTIPPDIM